MKKAWFFMAPLVLGLLALEGCRKKEAPPSPPPGQKVAMIITSQNFRDEELLKPKEILEKAGLKVFVVSTTRSEVRGMLGAKVTPDLLLSELSAEDYAAIVFVGGVGASQYWDDPLAHEICRKALEKGKVLGAICIAPVTLARAGVLSGKKATVFPTEAEKLREKGAIYTGAKVEKDGRIITASGPEAAKDFAKALIEALALQSPQ
ncbi:MAG: DJ-1/PfpI family protein [Candidatus Bipolaricaulaceae bacterium]